MLVSTKKRLSYAHNLSGNKMLKRSILLLAFLFSGAALAQKTLVFSANEVSGNNTEIQKVLQKAYDQLGYQFEIRELPSARALSLSNNGVFDGDLNRIHNANSKYTHLIPVSVPVHTFKVVAFGKTRGAELTGWRDLYPHQIGLINGLIYAELATENHTDLQFIKVNSADQLFNMLSMGRIDYAVISKQEGIKALKRLNLKNIYMENGVIETNSVFHYLHEKHLALIPQLEKILSEMWLSGEINNGIK